MWGFGSDGSVIASRDVITCFPSNFANGSSIGIEPGARMMFFASSVLSSSQVVGGAMPSFSAAARRR